MCICPLKDKCISEHAIRLPDDVTGRAGWLSALGSDYDGKDGRVSATHWPENELKFTENGKVKRAVKTALPRLEPRTHNLDELEKWSSQWNALETVCVCGLGEEQCGQNITEFYNRPKDDDVAAKWLAKVRPANASPSNATLMNAFSRFKVAKHHFKAADIQPGHNPYPRKDALPTFHIQAPEAITWPPRREPPSPAQQEARSLLGPRFTDKSALTAIIAVIEVRDEFKMALDAEVEFGEEEKDQLRGDTAALKTLLYASLEKSDEHCW
jgi:hypothetical protein